MGSQDRRPESRKIDATIIGAVIGAVALVLAAVVSGLFSLNSAKPSPPVITPTTVVYQTALPTTGDTATLTDAPGPTVTAAGSDNGGVYPPYLPGHGILVFSDTMSSFRIANHWANDSVGCTFKNSAYYVTATQYVYTCGEYAQDFTNFAFTTQVQLLPGTTGELVFRADSTFKNMYGIAINASNDSYAFRVYTDGQGSILKLGHSPVIAQNTNGFYQFDVVANGNTLAFYLNRHEIDSVTDGTYARGLAGFQIAGNGAGDGNTGMVVENVGIWRL